MHKNEFQSPIKVIFDCARAHANPHARTHVNACTHTCSIFVKIFIDDEYGTYWDDEIGDNDDGQDDNDDT